MVHSFRKYHGKLSKLLLIPVIILGNIFINPTNANAANFSMKTGYYIGNGSTQTIGNLGFTPNLVIIKSDSNVGTGVFKTSAMPTNTTGYFAATALDTSSMITFSADNFAVSSSTVVNGANSRYTYTAFGGSDCTASGTFCVGTYTGNGSNPRLINTGFQPVAAIVKRSTAVAASFRTKDMAANYGQYFTTAAQVTNGGLFSTISSNGFNVGSAVNNVSSGVYYYAAFKEVSGIMQTGTYSGNGSDNRNITGFGGGSTPSLVIVKNSNSSTTANRNPVMSQTHSYGDQSSFMSTATATEINMIQALQGGGFQVGSGVRANQNGNAHFWMAWGGEPALPQGDGTFSMATGTYTGNGSNNRQITGVGFKPDLVLIKRDNDTQAVVMRTSMMNSNISTALTLATASMTDAIIGLTSDGFTLGTNAAVNTTGGTYHWQAFGNAYDPVTRTGSSDFMIGAYTGNGSDNRPIAVPDGLDLVTIKQHNGTSSSTVAYWRTTANSGDQANGFHDFAATADIIQNMTPDSFEIGANGGVNTNNRLYFWFGFKQGSNFNVGSYTGTGNTQTISSLGLQPDLLWVKRDTNVHGVLRPSTLAGNSTQQFQAAANISNGITGFTLNGFSLASTTTNTNASGGTYFYAAWREPSPGILSIDIVNASGTPVATPSVAMAPLPASFTCDTSTGTLGTSAQRLRITNTTTNPNWSVGIAATSGGNALWSASGGKYYDFNDPSGSPNGCADGIDTDSYAGQLTFSPTGANITPISGCNSSGVIPGAVAGFQEGVFNSLNLVSGAGAQTSCYWDITNIGISQTIAPQVSKGTYTLNLTLTVVAN